MVLRARSDGRRAVDWLARLGLGARGIVYLLVAWTAARIAIVHSGQEADRQGALQQLASQQGGRVVLVLMAIGFAGYALWRVTQVIWGVPGEDGAKDRGKRAVSAGRAALYFGFAWTTAKTVISGHGGSGSDSTSKRATGGVLAHTGGRTLVIIAGAGFIVAGIALAIRGITRKFERHLKTAEMGRKTEAVVSALGVGGQTARGVVFAVIGGFLIDAAASFDPHKARGLDGALRALAQPVGGRVLLVAVAVGLACFGAYSLAEARYRET